MTTCKVAGLNGSFYADFNFNDDGEDSPVFQVIIPGVAIPIDNNFRYRPEKIMKCRAVDNPNGGDGSVATVKGKKEIDSRAINIVCEFTKK